MKYAKMLGLLAVAAAALMAFAGTASATTVTSPSGTSYTGVIHAHAGVTTLSGSFVTVECKTSTVLGHLETHGSSVTAGGKITELNFKECNFETTVNKAGSLEIHTDKATADGNGTLTSTGAEVTIKTSVGTCIFTTNATDVGTVTGGAPAKLNIAGASIPRTGGSAGFLCGASGTWKGEYTVTTPSPLFVD